MSGNYREDLAYIHDAGFGRTAEAAAHVLFTELRARNVYDGLVVDLGCGSGILSAKMHAAGYLVLGIDLSEAMIALARKRAPQAEFRVDSLFTAELPPCVAVAIVGEGINYLFDEWHSLDRIELRLQDLFRSLEPGGLLLLDVAAPGRVQGGQSGLRAMEGDGWAVLFGSAESAGGILTRRITSFRRVGELYRRDEEVHRQRLIDPKTFDDLLRAAGFRVRVLEGYAHELFPPALVGFLAEKPLVKDAH